MKDEEEKIQLHLRHQRQAEITRRKTPIHQEKG
jgi:hypothetical protein